MDDSDGFVTLFVFQAIRSAIMTAWRSAHGIGIMTRGAMGAVHNGTWDAGGTGGVTMQT